KERGSYVLIVARFIPGGRTATTFTSGLVHLRWLTQFAPFILIASVLWALYGALLGYLGGRIFRDHPLYAPLVSFGIAGSGSGAGTPVTVVDTGLDVGHAEFAARPNTTLLNAQSTNGDEEETHGTAVSSVLAAPENGFGIVGIYPQAALGEWDSGPMLVSDVI